MTRTVWDFLGDVAEKLSDLEGRLAAHEARAERMFRKGKVTDVDATKQLYRQEIGVDDLGQPVKSPWVPYAQIAGNRKTHSAPSVGQQMLLISPDGDHEQGHGVPFTWSTDQPSPSQDPDADVDQRGKTKLTQRDGAWMQEVEGASIALSKGKIVLTAGGSNVTIIDGKVVTTSTKIAEVGTVYLGAEDASRELSLKGTIDSAGHAEQGNLATKVYGT